MQKFKLGDEVYYAGYNWVISDFVEKDGSIFYSLNGLDLEVPEELLLHRVYVDKNTLNDYQYKLVDINGEVGRVYFFLDSSYKISILNGTYETPFLYGDGKLKDEDILTYVYSFLREDAGYKGLRFVGKVEDYLKWMEND